MDASAPLPDPLGRLLARQRVLVLDGGLATELEARGCRLGSGLWSAEVLLEQPALIRQIHLDYLMAGADCIVSASYQATLEGFRSRGYGTTKAADLLRLSVALACQARSDFWAVPDHRRGRLPPLVAASVGPYGAFLADGSEFRGDYDLGEEELIEFHRRRLEILDASGADLLACETIPSRTEARALFRLLQQTPGTAAWLSFSCRDGRHLNDGSPVATVVAELDGLARIAAVGVNCTSPWHISSLIREIRSATEKPILVYPNSGEGWDADRKRWTSAGSGTPSLSDSCREWARLGARLIGGCCRLRPRDIALMRRSLLGDDP
jgi:homocysteine S-methyltransferase